MRDIFLLFTPEWMTYILPFFEMLFMSFFHKFFVELCKKVKREAKKKTTFIFLLSLDAISGLECHPQTQTVGRKNVELSIWSAESRAVCDKLDAV
jgi:hypothetical protein